MADSEEPQSSEQVCNFFRKPSKNKNIRKRTIDTDGDAEDDDQEKSNVSSVIHKPKKPPRPDNKLHFSTGGSSKRATESAESNAEESKDTPLFHFESSKEIQVHHDSRATATLETETEFSKDARAIRERVLRQAEDTLKGKKKGVDGEKVYKGIHGYTDYKAGFRREQTVSGEKASGAHGPLRASAHIRSSARFDYQPDICKDYKETGYCGFGDACKFMHDRGDYKSGWQMEREWEEAEKVRKRNLALGGDDDVNREGGNQSDDDEDDSLPFACFICRQSFEDPVVTKCKHYFCEHCALKVFKGPASRRSSISLFVRFDHRSFKWYDLERSTNRAVQSTIQRTRSAMCAISRPSGSSTQLMRSGKKWQSKNRGCVHTFGSPYSTRVSRSGLSSTYPHNVAKFTLFVV